jgi:glycosyltransferase involved in cell wall biosynthesis
MKVLMVISQFRPIIGGAEKQAELLAKKLVEKGIQVQVVTGSWKIGTPRKEIINGIQIFRNFSFWGMFGVKGLRPLAALTYMVTLGIYLLLHRREFDIIHVHQVLHPAFISVLTGKGILKKPVLAKNACSGITSDIKCLRQYPFGNLQLKYIIGNLDCLIGVNQEGINEFKAIGYPETNIQHIPNGVFPSLIKKEKGNQILFAITTVRLDRQKGIDILLKSWAKVVAQEKTVRLLILGKGPLESELKKLVTSLKLMDSVDFVGLVSNPEEYLRKSEIFILPSRAEGMSNALLEAMCIGLSCIATNISGNAELISENSNKPISLGEFAIEKNGILINPDDIEGLCKAILFLIQNRKEREDMGRRSQEFVRKNYSIDLIADKYITLYQRMLKGNSKCVASVEK